MSTRTRFEKEAKANSEMAYFTARNCSEVHAHVTHAYFLIFHHSTNQILRLWFLFLLLKSLIVKLP